jgi:hypothetical protein
MKIKEKNEGFLKETNLKKGLILLFFNGIDWPFLTDSYSVFD